MINRGIEKSALRGILLQKKRNDFSEEDFIDGRSQIMLRLMKKYEGDEVCILGELDNIGGETSEYGYDIISSIGGYDVNRDTIYSELRKQKVDKKRGEIMDKIKYARTPEEVEKLVSDMPVFVNKEEDEITSTAVCEVYKNAIEGNKTRRISTGFITLDNRLDGGFYPGNLIVIAGRPGTGKSVFALNCMIHQTIRAKEEHIKGLYFSLEMGAKEVMMRVYSTRTGIPFATLRKGELAGDDEFSKKLEAITNEILESGFRVIDNMYSYYDIENKIRACVREGLDIVYIDYLGLMEIPGDSRYIQITEMTRRLKELGRALNIPIVILAQMNRKESDRAYKVPQLSDLRDSGSIEQDADVVLMLYKDNEDSNEVILAIKKNRNGPNEVEITYITTYEKMRLQEKY